VKYLRLSVTIVAIAMRYCMSEAMTFLPSKECSRSKSSIGSPDAHRLGSKNPVTGGEPLVRKEIMQLSAAFPASGDAGCRSLR